MNFIGTSTKLVGGRYIAFREAVRGRSVPIKFIRRLLLINYMIIVVELHLSISIMDVDDEVTVYLFIYVAENGGFTPRLKLFEVCVRNYT